MLNWFVILCASTLLTFGCRPEQPPATPASQAESSLMTDSAPQSPLLMSADPDKNLELGEVYYRRSCASCHDTGAGGTPQLGDIAAWTPRIAQGLDTLVHHAIDGHGSSACAMPPRGGHPDLHIEAVALAVRYMIEMSLPEGQRLQPVISQQAPAHGPATAETRLLLQQPIQPQLVEYAAAALPVWRQHRNLRPTLVMLANDPLLEPLPPTLREDIKQLVGAGTAEQIAEQSQPQSPAPLLRSTMAVSAALEADLFSRVVWVLPTPQEKTALSLEAFRDQLLRWGALTQAETATLALEDGRFTGTIRGIPWEAVPISRFPGTQGPVVVHLDLDFFRPLYRDEIKSPLYALLQEVLLSLRTAELQTLVASISLSQVTGTVPLTTRFLGKDLAAILRNPELLNDELPLHWRRRQDTLYLQNFIEKQRVHDLYLAMVEDSPQDASVHYGLYQSFRERNEGSNALESLALAVELDPVYALEYLDLAQLARQKELPGEVLRMFDLAARSAPDNPFIPLERARFLIGQGEGGEALKLLNQLERLPWSAVFYPTLPQVIAREKAAATKLPSSRQPAPQ